MPEGTELRDRVALLEDELAALKAEVTEDGASSETPRNDPESGETSDAGGGDLSRRRLLGAGGLAGVASLLAVGSGASSGTARAQAAGSVGTTEHPVDVHAETVAVQGGLAGELAGGETVTQLVGENLFVSNGRLDAAGGIDEGLVDEMEAAVAELAMVSGGGNTWRVGPEEPTGSGHDNPLWGIHFETEYETYLGETAIDSLSPGWVTFAVYEYDGSDLGSLVDTRRVRTTGALQRIHLDFRLGPGEYLLTRLAPVSQDSDLWEGDRENIPESVWSPADTQGLSLIRLDSAYDWEGPSQNGVTFHGGDHPLYDANGYFYYFYDLQIATKEGA